MITIRALRRHRDGGRGNRNVAAHGHTASSHLGDLLPLGVRHDLVLEMRGPRCLEGTADRTKQRVKHLAGLSDRLRVNGRLLTLAEGRRSRAVEQTKLRVVPDGLNRVNAVGHADTGTSAGELPVLGPVDAQLREDFVYSSDELVHLL